MRFLLSLSWRDLRAGGRNLWVFCTCLALGVTLVAATGGLYKQVGDALLADTRALMGGDLEVDARSPLPEDVLAWMRDNGSVSLVTELRTMLGTADGEFRIVELLSVDDHYPLYGELKLHPAGKLESVTALRGDRWGMAVDPVLADRLNIKVGDEVRIGSLTMEVRARIRKQPDRSLRADWRGAPVLIDARALAASGLVQPSSRIDYEYRVRTDESPESWRDRFYASFPDGEWEVHTFTRRSERIAERLDQVASALLIIGLSTLFIGGLGVFNSIHAYLQGKLATIATLRTLGLRNRRLAGIYLLQVGMLAGFACLIGAAAGYFIAIAGASLVASQMPVATAASSALLPLLTAAGFGIATAYTFAMPAIGRALSVNAAALFRDIDGSATQTPRGWWLATLAGALVIAMLVILILPDALFGAAFLLVTVLLLGLLDAIVHGLRRLARSLDDHPALGNRFALRLALANLHRPGSPLRVSLLSLGTALTLLVACTLIVTTLVQVINDTVPEEAPGLVLQDISADQLDDVTGALRQTEGVNRVDMAPLVLGRLLEINGESLGESSDDRRRREARDEHKLTYRAGNIDDVTMDRGDWWSGEASGGAQVVMEDREADQLDLEVGDRLTFSIEDRTLQAELTGIYRQKGIQTRFWFEAIFSDGALDPFIYRHVGAAYMDDATAIRAQKNIAAIAPNVVTVRTASILETARELLGKAVTGLAAVAATSLLVSLLVLTGVMATSRTRQIYDATILHALGVRLSVIRRSLQLEYLLLALITSVFAIVLGTAIAWPLLLYRLKLDTDITFWPGAVTAVIVSIVCLNLGAAWLLRRLRLRPALLLRSGG